MKKKYSTAEITEKLRQADILLGKGKSTLEVCKELEIRERTYCRWRRNYHGMSPDMIERYRALRKEHALRICKITVIFIVVCAGATIGLLYFVYCAFSRLDPKFRECEPATLLPDLEKQLEMKFPTKITEVKAARTAGSRDHPTESDFLVKFFAEPNTVDKFLKSFSIKITPVKYDRSSDKRKIFGARTPQWFTDPITKGKEWSWTSWRNIYIDTTDENNFVVYFMGSYFRDLDEVRKEWEKY